MKVAAVSRTHAYICQGISSVCVCVSMWALGRHTSVTLLIVCWSRTHAKYRYVLPVAGRRVSNLSGRKKKVSHYFLFFRAFLLVRWSHVTTVEMTSTTLSQIAMSEGQVTGRAGRRGEMPVWRRKKRAAEDGTAVLPGGGRRPCLAGSGGSVRGDSMLSVSFPGCGRFEDMEMR